MHDIPSRRTVSPTGILRRLICALALVPIVFSTAMICADWLHKYVDWRGFDELRWTHLVISTLTVLASILIWRSVIVWTFGRAALTAVLSAVPFAQVAYGGPLWDAGCVTRDFLRFGQEQVGVGLWVWLMIWVWWGWERFGTRAKAALARHGRTRMTRSNKLVVASMGTIPFTVGMFFMILAFLDDLLGLSGPALVTATYAASAVIAVFAWTMVWRKKVRWTRALAGKTIASAALLLGVPIAGTFFGSGWANPWDTTFYLLPLLGWGLWMPATMWLWDIRVESVPEQEEGPVCLKCGYLLKGLTHTRCPECGAEPTLDELWAATCAAWG